MKIFTGDYDKDGQILDRTYDIQQAFNWGGDRYIDLDIALFKIKRAKVIIRKLENYLKRINNAEKI